MLDENRFSLLVVAMLFALSTQAIAEKQNVICVHSDKGSYLLGEPVVLRVDLYTTGMTERELAFAENRTSARIGLTRKDGVEFPPIPTVHVTSVRRKPAPWGFSDYVFLQPASFWRTSHRDRFPEWTEQFLQPGAYAARVQQTLLVDGERTQVFSNSAAFVVGEPAGRNLEAYEEMKNDPVILRMDSIVFPSRFIPGDNIPGMPALTADRSYAAFQRNIEFAREYIDTPYGQFAAVNCAMAGRFDQMVDLYPALGRLIELRPQQDFVTQHARYVSLRVDSLLADATDLEKRLADREEFLQSLQNPPVSLRSELEREIASLKDTIENPPPGPLFNFDSIEGWTQRLVERGEWPPDPEVRERRRAIALGRED